MLCMNCWAGQAREESTICERCEEKLTRARESHREQYRNLTGTQRALKLAGMLFVALLLSCAPAFASGDVPDAAVVRVQITEERSQAVCEGMTCRRINRKVVVAGGSAVVFSDAETRSGKKGWVLLTARHVVDVSQNQRIEVGLGKQWIPAEVIRFSKYADLALIGVTSSQSQVLACLSQADPTAGDEVTVGGFVLGKEYQRRRARAGGRVNQTDCRLTAEHSIQLGDSGGGVFDRRGNLCGIVFARETEAPWNAVYVGVDEIRRFLAVSWSPSYATPPLRVDGPEPEKAGHGPSDKGRWPDKPAEQSKPTPIETGKPALASGAVAEPTGERRPAVAEPDSETPLDETAKEGSAESAPVTSDGVKNFRKNLGPIAVLKPDGVLDVGKNLAAEDATSRVTMEKSSEKRAPIVERAAAWWDFGKASVVLAAAVAAGLSTGGIGWLTVVRPAMKQVATLRALIRVHHSVPPDSPRPPPNNPPVVTIDTPPGPQVMTTSTQFASVQVDHVSEALAFAMREIVRKYPGSVDTVTTLQSLVNQFLASKGHSLKV